MTQEEYGLELFKGLNPLVGLTSRTIKYYSRPWDTQLIYHWVPDDFICLTYWRSRVGRGMAWRIIQKISLRWPDDMYDPETHKNLIQLIEDFKNDITRTE